ncbi:MAG: hypothetical protein ACYSXF_10995 [Planctomycetota bacterium]|jgi:hypothetical protein
MQPPPTVVPNQFVILSREEPTADGLAPLGPRDRIVRELFDHNTGPERDGDDVLYGPGIQIELPPGQALVRQMLVTITEEEIGLLVLERLAQTFCWKVVDPETGQPLNP